MEMPDVTFLQFNKDVTQIRHWSLNAPDNLTAMVKYHHDRIVQSLKAENEVLKGDKQRIKEQFQETDVLYWQQVKEIAELKAKLDKAKWQPIETYPPLGQWYFVSCDKWVSDHKHKITLLAFADCVDDDGIFWISDQDGSRIYPTHWMPLPDAPVKL